MHKDHTTLHLWDVLDQFDPAKFKLHLAQYNGDVQPLDIFVSDRTEWDKWSAWRSNRNDFSRQYIFSLIEFYPQRDTWLFGGVYEVISRDTKNYCHSYRVKKVVEYEKYVGRLKLFFKRPGRNRSLLMERYLELFKVKEILPIPYSGEIFPGFNSINISLYELKLIFNRQQSDWKSALASTSGIYLITDTLNGKRYVGSAYGGQGIWARWENYVYSGHGGNKQLRRLITEQGIEYAMNHFRLSLLEYLNPNTDKATVIARENHWKEVLMTRGEFGYNEN